MSDFTAFNLDEPLMRAITEQKYQTPTPIQESVIPLILEKHDVMASAQTGAGKTLAFMLPILQQLLKPSEHKEGRGPRAIILSPTRELADQIIQETAKMAKFTGLKFGSITGGVPYFAQEALLRKPCDIIVATPGRLIDHMDKGRVDFSRVELFTLDEADRMLDMGFMPDIENIFGQLTAKPQVLLFSATFEGDVYNIANRFLKDPQRVQLTSRVQQNSLITQQMHPVNNFNHKRAILAHILEDASVWQAIVFTATKRSATELADELYAQDIACAELHGDMKQSKRTRTIEKMRQGKIRVLVATDVAARGLDIKSLSHVINFDLPKSGEDYIHRIGRTGRAGETGTAISLVSPREQRLLNQIERYIGSRLERVNFTNFEFSKVESHKQHKAQNEDFDDYLEATDDAPKSNGRTRGRNSRDDRRDDDDANRGNQARGRRDRNEGSRYSRDRNESAGRTSGSRDRNGSPSRARGSRDRNESSARSRDRYEGSNRSRDRDEGTRYSRDRNASRTGDRPFRENRESAFEKRDRFDKPRGARSDKASGRGRSDNNYRSSSSERNKSERGGYEKRGNFEKRGHFEKRGSFEKGDRFESRSDRRNDQSRFSSEKTLGNKKFNSRSESRTENRSERRSEDRSETRKRFDNKPSRFANKKHAESPKSDKPILSRKKTIDANYLAKKEYENNPKAKASFTKKPFKKKAKQFEEA